MSAAALGGEQILGVQDPAPGDDIPHLREDLDGDQHDQPLDADVFEALERIG